MDNKRKAASTAGAGNPDNDRAVKRRKMPGPITDYDLARGETHESTTAYGLHFLDMIRRTKDKSGRTVADYFENLLPKEGNAEYYRRIKLPISLKTIERKLHNQDFANLSELEGYFKRMVMNAKDFYNRSSDIYDDAERVRKALSNYMTKTNPAYKTVAGYSCQPAPLPDSPSEMPEEEEEATANNSIDAEGEEEDAEGEEEDENGGEDGEDDDEEDRNPKKIILKRKGPGRPPRLGSTPVRKTERGSKGKADHDFEGVPYAGLSFQHAQEKIVEELIRKPDGPDPYFLDFINLPARAYKEYFAVITNPLSIKGLQKQVKGIRGRAAATGVSDFKSWTAFEERASLLWTNAHFFNEPDSKIYQLATELKECFEKELAEAKAVVQEPPQPKIKLRLQAGQETPTASAKRITIHVKDTKGSTTTSPAPLTGQSNDSNLSENGGDRRTTGPRLAPAPLAPQHIQLEKARSASTSGQSPSPSYVSARLDAPIQPGPNMQPRMNGTGPLGTPNGAHAAQNTPQRNGSLQNGHSPMVHAPPPPPLYDQPFRSPGRGLNDALLPNLLVRTLYGVPVPPERRFRLEIPAHPKLAHQNFTVHIPANQHKLQIVPTLSPLDQQQRHHRLFVTLNGLLVTRGTPTPAPDDPLPPNAMVFEVMLQPGTNQIVVAIIAALPKGQKLPGGAECEVERITINAHLSKFATS
ncbi:Bromodomain-containing protein [Podospora conica]|nr:Bromodomain-containing protein [Schizothecium conicum]